MAEVFDFGLQQHKIKMDGKFFENNLFAVAGDTGRRLEVQLLDSNNTVQNTTGISLRLNANVAGQATYAEATLVDATKGLYELDLPNGMLIAPGNWQFQWQIIGVNGEKLHSFAFMGSIGSNLSEGGTEALNFYLNLEELKQMQEDFISGAFDSEVLETNIAEKLTDLETQYAPKLTEVTAQLAQITLNVKNFLCDDGQYVQGDGIHDDTTGIQRALDNDSNVHFPKNSKYNITATLINRFQGRIISGGGYFTTVITTVNEIDMWINDFNALETASGSDNEIYGIQFDGKNKALSCMRFKVSINSEIRNCRFTSAKKLITFEDGTHLSGNTFYKNSFREASQVAIYIPYGGHGTSITKNDMAGNVHGIVLGKLNADNTFDYDFNANAGASITIDKNTIQGNRGVDVFIGNGNFATTIEENYFETTVNQPNKVCYIRVGNKFLADGTSEAVGRVIGLSIEKNYFYSYPGYATTHPVIILGRTMNVSISGNNSLSPNQVFVDTSEWGVSGSFDFDNNYVNGGKYTSDDFSPISATKNNYPISKHFGHEEIDWIWDNVTKTYKQGFTKPNTKDGIYTFGEAFVNLGKGLQPTSFSSVKVTASSGVVNIVTNSTKVFSLGDLLLISLNFVAITETATSLLLNLDTVLPAGKKINFVTAGQSIGDFYLSSNPTSKNSAIADGSNNRIKLMQGSGSNIPAGTTTISGSLMIPLTTI